MKTSKVKDIIKNLKKVSSVKNLPLKPIIIGAAITVVGVGAITLSNAMVPEKEIDSFGQVVVNRSTTHVNSERGYNKTPKDLDIMGYKPVDYMQVMSYILTSAPKNGFSIEDMNLAGYSLEEHIVNADTVGYHEDVDPNVILVQQMIETSHFMFKYNDSNGVKVSSVKPEYYNFSGLGATDKNPKPNKFYNNIEGQLAQAQHLVAYATTGDVKTTLVDKRFNYVKRGSATTVEGLSKAWASNSAYGEHIARKYNELMNHEINEELVKKYAGKIYGEKPVK